MNIAASHIHPTAEISEQAEIGLDAHISAFTRVGEYAVIGDRCRIGSGVYIDARALIGSNVNIQNSVSILEGVSIADGVFIGSHVCFTNDLFPRAINLDGALRGSGDWQITPTIVEYSASIGAGSVVRCGVKIGKFAVVAAGTVITRDVMAHSLVGGSPARHKGYVCLCAYLLERVHTEDGQLIGYCPRCDLIRDITP